MDERQDESTGEPGSNGTGDGSTAEHGAKYGRGPAANQMVSQLQSMIDSISRQAGPAVREVAAKAAELAAVAAERAGPIAHRAAEVTEEVGVKVAARSKEVAADLRRNIEGQRSAGPAETSDMDTAGSALPDEGETPGETSSGEVG